MQDHSQPVCHIFLNNERRRETQFSPSAWKAHKRQPNLPVGNISLALFRWHYRHCVIHAWGVDTLKSRLHPLVFPSGGEDSEFAICSRDFDEPQSCLSCRSPFRTD